MRGRVAGSDWTHRSRAFSSRASPAASSTRPLVAIAVGVAHPRHAGMASGTKQCSARSASRRGSRWSDAIHQRGTPGAFADGMNELLLIAATALSVGVLTLALIRQRDFAVQRPAAAADGAGPGERRRAPPRRTVGEGPAPAEIHRRELGDGPAVDGHHDALAHLRAPRDRGDIVAHLAWRVRRHDLPHESPWLDQREDDGPAGRGVHRADGAAIPPGGQPLHAKRTVVEFVTRPVAVRIRVECVVARSQPALACNGRIAEAKLGGCLRV